MLAPFDPRVRTRGPCGVTAGLAAVLLVLTAACGDAPGPVTPAPADRLVPLAAATWFLHEAGGSPVPGASVWLPGASEKERIEVDSARFVAEADGSLTHRAWFVRTEADGSQWSVSVVSTGRWLAGSEAYTLTLGSSGAGMLLRPIEGGDGLEGDETHSGTQGGAAFPVVYRTVPPSGL
jgi:hypothetical protein